MPRPQGVAPRARRARRRPVARGVPAAQRPISTHRATGRPAGGQGGACGPRAARGAKPRRPRQRPEPPARGGSAPPLRRARRRAGAACAAKHMPCRRRARPHPGQWKGSAPAGPGPCALTTSAAAQRGRPSGARQRAGEGLPEREGAQRPAAAPTRTRERQRPASSSASSAPAGTPEPAPSDDQALPAAIPLPPRPGPPGGYQVEPPAALAAPSPAGCRRPPRSPLAPPGGLRRCLGHRTPSMPITRRAGAALGRTGRRGIPPHRPPLARTWPPSGGWAGHSRRLHPFHRWARGEGVNPVDENPCRTSPPPSRPKGRRGRCPAWMTMPKSRFAGIAVALGTPEGLYWPHQ